MSRTYKDRPYSLGGDRHRWYCVDNHGAHAKFTTTCRRMHRHITKRLWQTYDWPDMRTRYQTEYFD